MAIHKDKERDRIRHEREIIRNGQTFLIVKTYSPKKHGSQTHQRYAQAEVSTVRRNYWRESLSTKHHASDGAIIECLC